MKPFTLLLNLMRVLFLGIYGHGVVLVSWELHQPLYIQILLEMF